MTLTDLDAMSQAKSGEIDRTNLVDVKTIHIDAAQPATRRMEQYLAQIRNPYCFLCGESVVRLRFEPDGEPLQSRLKNYFINCKKA